MTRTPQELYDEMESYIWTPQEKMRIENYRHNGFWNALEVMIQIKKQKESQKEANLEEIVTKLGKIAVSESAVRDTKKASLKELQDFIREASKDWKLVVSLVRERMAIGESFGIVFTKAPDGVWEMRVSKLPSKFELTEEGIKKIDKPQ